MKQTHILVVEDEKHTLKSIEITLINAGYKVSLAENGYEALFQLNSLESIDLIVSDIYMPKLNAFDLVELLRFKGCNPKYVLITGYGSRDLDARIRELGLGKPLYKPFTPEDLLGAVRENLGEDFKVHRTSSSEENAKKGEF